MGKTAFVLERESYWNDIDHVTSFYVVALFDNEQLAKDYAQQLYTKENPNEAFNMLQWFETHSDFPPPRQWIETRIDFDKYKVNEGNFHIEEYVINGKEGSYPK